MFLYFRWGEGDLGRRTWDAYVPKEDAKSPAQLSTIGVQILETVQGVRLVIG